jgi:nitrite reductase/ring-hydroxylating ferredoxin subunit/uncharacterized membrane protein
MTSTPSTFPSSPPSGRTAGALAERPLLQRLWDLPVHLPWLDHLAAPITRVVHAVEPRWLADLLHGSWLGHALHPVLAQGTVGLWTSAGLLDALALTGLVPEELEDGVEAASSTLVNTGLGASLATIASGWTDWSDLHNDQQRIGLVHASANYTATALFAASTVQRVRGRRTSGQALSVAAFSVAGIGAALGGHLSYRWAAGTNHAEHVPHRVPEGWYRVAAWDDLPVGAPVAASVGDVRVVVVREEEGVHVLADTCSHLAGPLSEGEVSRVDGQACITCPWHQSTFRLADGGVVHGPATSPQPHFETRVSAEGDVLARFRELPGVSGEPALGSAVR